MPSRSDTPGFLIVGGGIFGLSTALELSEQGHKVTLLNDHPIPSPGASSNDISKIVRMEYGTDTLYMDLAAECIRRWREWNSRFDTQLYYETGFLLLSGQSFDSDPDGFEASSFRNLISRGYKPERLDSDTITKNYPVFSPGFTGTASIIAKRDSALHRKHLIPWRGQYKMQECKFQRTAV